MVGRMAACCVFVGFLTYAHSPVCVFVCRVPVPGMETHTPVLFLNLKRTSAKAHEVLFTMI